MQIPTSPVPVAVRTSVGLKDVAVTLYLVAVAVAVGLSVHLALLVCRSLAAMVVQDRQLTVLLDRHRAAAAVRVSQPALQALVVNAASGFSGDQHEKSTG